MTFNFLGPGLTVNVEAKVKEQIILDSSDSIHRVLRKRCSSNITLNGLVGPELFNRHLKAVENLDGFFLSEIF